MSSIRAGSNIDSWCTKCKLVLAHTIEAVLGSVIKRVVCNTCKGKHQYKACAPNTIVNDKVKSTSNSKTSKKVDTDIKNGSYNKLIKDKNEQHAIAYSIKSKLVKGDLIKHQIFGLGVVIEDKEACKIEVLFENGLKILAHNR